MAALIGVAAIAAGVYLYKSSTPTAAPVPPPPAPAPSGRPANLPSWTPSWFTGNPPKCLGSVTLTQAMWNKMPDTSSMSLVPTPSKADIQLQYLKNMQAGTGICLNFQ